MDDFSNVRQRQNVFLVFYKKNGGERKRVSLVPVESHAEKVLVWVGLPPPLFYFFKKSKLKEKSFEKMTGLIYTVIIQN